MFKWLTNRFTRRKKSAVRPAEGKRRLIRTFTVNLKTRFMSGKDLLGMVMVSHYDVEFEGVHLQNTQVHYKYWNQGFLQDAHVGFVGLIEAEHIEVKLARQLAVNSYEGRLARSLG